MLLYVVLWCSICGMQYLTSPILNLLHSFVNKALFCFRLYDVVKIGYALAMFFTYFLQFYVPMQILVPSIRRRFHPKSRNCAETVFRVAMVILTCMFVRKYFYMSSIAFSFFNCASIVFKALWFLW